MRTTSLLTTFASPFRRRARSLTLLAAAALLALVAPAGAGAQIPDEPDPVQPPPPSVLPKPYGVFDGTMFFAKRQGMGFFIEPDGSVEMHISFYAKKSQCNPKYGDQAAVIMTPNKTLPVRPDGRFSGKLRSEFPSDTLRIVAHAKVRGRFITPRRAVGTVSFSSATVGHQRGQKVAVRCSPSTVRFKARKV